MGVLEHKYCKNIVVEYCKMCQCLIYLEIDNFNMSISVHFSLNRAFSQTTPHKKCTLTLAVIFSLTPSTITFVAFLSCQEGSFKFNGIFYDYINEKISCVVL